MTADRLSMATAALMAAASTAGLLRPAIYRDNPLVASGWFGNDLVTLAVACPLLVVAAGLARRRSPRARLVMFGMLDYAVYNYAFYLFGAAFNALFLLYVAVTVFAAAGLIFGLSALDARGFAEAAARAPARAVAVFMLIVAAGLGGFWAATSLAYVFTGEVPAVVAAVGHPTNVIAALDLSLVVPLMLIAGIWLWQRRPWGYVLAVVANVKGAVYMLALSAATVTALRAGASEEASQLALWIPIGAGSLVASAALLRRR